MTTTCLTLNLSEHEVGYVKTFHRQPIISRDILRMSKLLEAAERAHEN